MNLSKVETAIIHIFEQAFRDAGGDPQKSANPLVWLAGRDLMVRLTEWKLQELEQGVLDLEGKSLLTRMNTQTPLPRFEDQEWELLPPAYQFMSRV